MAVINVTNIYHRIILKRFNSKAMILLNEIADSVHKTPDVVEKEFIVFLGKYIIEYIKWSVRQQRLNKRHMKTRYLPLSESYQKTKPPKTRAMHWYNTGTLINSLVVSYSKDFSSILITTNNKFHNPKGVKAKDKNKTKSKDIIMWNELGTKKMPARPLFQPAIDNIIRNLTKILQMYYKANYK